MRIIPIIVAIAVAQGCALPEFMKKKRENSTNSVKDVETTDQDGVLTGTMSATSGSTQRISGKGALSGSSVQIAPGALSIDTNISIQQGASVADATMLSEVAGQNSFTASAAAVIISSSASADPAGSLLISVPAPAGASFMLAEDPFLTLAIIYRAEIKSTGSIIAGIIPRSALKIVRGSVSFEAKNFGVYQAVLMKEVITVAAQATSFQPIVNKSGASTTAAPIPTNGSIVIAANAAYSKNADVALTLAATGATSMYLTNTANCTSGGTWEAFNAAKSTWTLGQLNATATVYVKFKSSETSESACVSDTIIHDNTLPDAPTFTSTTPASPSALTSFTLKGSAASSDSASVVIYDDVACTSILGSGTKTVFESTGISLNAAANAAKNYYAAIYDSAGNRSATCPLITTFTNDSIPPTDPVFATITPSSPSSSITPSIAGTSSADTVTVRIYLEATCNLLAGTGPKASFDSSGIALILAPNATTTLYGKALDLAGNVSTNCAALTTYTTDSLPAPAPTGLQLLEHDREVDLKWFTGSGDTIGFIVIRSTGTVDAPSNGFTYTAPSTLGTSTVVYVGPNPYFTNTGLNNGTPYNYAVHAYDAALNYSASILGTVVPASGFTSIASGGNHTCAIGARGIAYCWGYGINGELGTGVSASASKPTEVSTASMPAGERTFIKITVGFSHSCGITTGGLAYCWGSDTDGKLGNSTNGSSNSPSAVVTSEYWKDISAGFNHTCALNGAGQVFCWGDNTYGQFGNNTFVSSQVPVPITGYSFRSISAGMNASCGINNYGSAFCWGDDSRGQLGNGIAITAPKEYPVTVDASGMSGNYLYKSVSIGVSGDTTFATACGITGIGRAYCWGDGSFGQIGNNAVASSTLPAAVDISGLAIPDQEFVQLAIGRKSVCGLTGTGKAFCWGNDILGQLGNPVGETADKITPYPVTMTGLRDNEKLIEIAGGTYHFCAISSRGSIYCWGQNGTVDGRLGISDITTNIGYEISSPVDSTGRLEAGNVKLIANGINHTCAVYTEGRGKCWGADTNGMLGNGAITGTQLSPSPIDTSPIGTGNRHFHQISSATSHSCGVTAAGKGWCWGDDSSFNLGNGATTGSQASPYAIDISVNTDIVFTKIETGATSSCGLTTTGQIYCWGANGDGQLGDSTVVAKDKPVAVDLTNVLASEQAFIDLKVSSNHACALAVSGNSLCWGSDANEQLGNGPGVTNQLLPGGTAGGNLYLTQITVGEGFSCGIKINGDGYCWGSDTYGEAGNGASAAYDSPGSIDMTAISSFGNVKQLSAGDNHICGLTLSGRAWCWGYGLLGQLGNAATTGANSPSAVAPAFFPNTSNHVRFLSSGGNTSHAILSDGFNYGWGANTAGQIGSGTTASSQLTPLAIVP